MLPICADLRDEVDELHAFLGTLDDADWNVETGFMSWTPWDVVAHLHYFDLVSMVSLEGEDVFAKERKALLASVGEGQSNKELARARFADLDAKALLSAWRERAHELAEKLGAKEPKARLPWFGPDMGVQMFTTARYMETWAHGQEVYDMKGVTRTFSDRIKNVAQIGVRTFGWTFVNRGRKAPGPPPYVELAAPSGETWVWNDPDEPNSVKGDAAEFCQVVTQTRNIADTGLQVTGPVATEWMSIAQCFAGGAVDPPAPGTRGPKGR